MTDKERAKEVERLRKQILDAKNRAVKERTKALRDALKGGK